jgi:hypothetical protein
MATNRDNDSADSPAPPRLIAALRQGQSQRVFVPPTVDEAVLRAARQHLAPVKQRSPAPLAHWFRWLAFATACVLLCVVFWLTRSGSPLNRAPAYAHEDLSRDGRVDILDAFLLARQLQSGDKPGPSLDLNGDGAADHRDVETIAAEAVKLEKGGRS